MRWSLAIYDFLDTLYPAEDYTNDEWQRQKVMKKATNVAFRLFQRELVTELRRQGYKVDGRGYNEIIVRSNEFMYYTIKNDIVDEFFAKEAKKMSGIQNNIMTGSLAKVTQKMSDNKQKIWDLGNDFVGDQLEQEISELLEGDLQKKDMGSSSVSRNTLEDQASPPSPESRMEGVKAEVLLKMLGRTSR